MVASAAPAPPQPVPRATVVPAATALCLPWAAQLLQTQRPTAQAVPAAPVLPAVMAVAAAQRKTPVAQAAMGVTPEVATPTAATRPTPPMAANGVLGVPVASKHLQGVDSLHSIVQMPKGIPVATFAIGTAGAANAALFAIALLATSDSDLRLELEAFRRDQTQTATDMVLPVTGSAA